MTGVEKCWAIYTEKKFSSSQTLSHINTPIFSNLAILHTHLPMKMEHTECSEKSAHKIRTSGNYPRRKHTPFRTRRKFEVKKASNCLQNKLCKPFPKDLTMAFGLWTSCLVYIEMKHVASCERVVSLFFNSLLSTAGSKLHTELRDD